MEWLLALLGFFILCALGMGITAGVLRNKHRHTWKVVGANYRRSDVLEFERASSTMAMHLINGTTTLTSECKECGEVKVEHHPGRVNHPNLRW